MAVQQHIGEAFIHRQTGRPLLTKRIAEAEYTGVPEAIRKLLFKAVGTAAGRESRKTDLEEVFSTVPTAVEWHAMVGEMHNNSSGGMSGCSYNMIKCWPAELSDSVYKCLVQCWTDKEIPVSWK